MLSIKINLFKILKTINFDLIGKINLWIKELTKDKYWNNKKGNSHEKKYDNENFVYTSKEFQPKLFSETGIADFSTLAKYRAMGGKIQNPNRGEQFWLEFFWTVFKGFLVSSSTRTISEKWVICPSSYWTKTNSIPWHLTPLPRWQKRQNIMFIKKKCSWDFGF